MVSLYIGERVTPNQCMTEKFTLLPITATIVFRDKQCPLFYPPQLSGKNTSGRVQAVPAASVTPSISLITATIVFRDKQPSEMVFDTFGQFMSGQFDCP